MPDFLPAAEWMAKSAARAVGVFLDSLARPRDILAAGDARRAAEAAAADAFAEAEAEQEVSEPRAIPCVVDDCPLAFDSIDALNTHSYWMHIEPNPFKTSDDPLVRFERYPGADEAGDFAWFTIKVTSPASKTSAVPPAVVDDPAGGAPASAPHPPAGSPNAVPVGVSARTPGKAAPPTGLSWPEWAISTICDVLAAHHPWESAGGIECSPSTATFEYPYSVDHLTHFGDHQAWREHVAPLIADHIGAEMTARARARDERLKTIDIWLTGGGSAPPLALDIFTQYQKPQQ